MTGEGSSRGYLLDTHAILFSMFQSHRLSATAKVVIAAGPNVLSVISFWEVMLKSAKRTLNVGDPRVWWKTAVEQLNAVPLMLRPEHVGALQRLPNHHKDPFDRMLMAQALTEELALVSADRELVRYKVAGLKIVR